MRKILNKISIVLVCYNSSFKLKKFVQKIPNETKIFIIDNSKDYSLKKIFRSKKNVKIYFKKNNDGYGASINFAAKRIKTPYFLVVQPDVTGIKKSSLINLLNYTLDKNERKIKKNNLELQLTEKEINFLILFSQNDKPLSRDFVLQKVWKYSPESDTHTVETHIHRLRKKILEKFNDNNFIKNNNEGYYI